MVIFNNYDDDSVLKVKDIFDNKFNCKLKKTKEFSLFDLRDNKNKIIIEVKKRNNLYNKYSTTMIGLNKYLKAQEYINREYKVFFVFEFLDGIYYYEFCNENYTPKIGGRNDRGFNEFKSYIYIPIEKLIKL